MTLRTVSVPASMAPIFARAEAVVSAFFRKRHDDPEKGTIEIFDERYVLMRAGALSVEFFGVVRDLLGDERHADADAFARNILFDLAHSVGRSDARNFHTKMQLHEPIERLSAGPMHFAHAGWAKVDIAEESVPGDADSYYLLYDHPYSFESDAWARAGERSDFPVCVMNAGYSSGWCEESFSLRLVATEVMCRARGDHCCRFIMAHPDRIEERLLGYAKEQGISAERLEKARIPDLFARKRLEDELRRARDGLELRVAERTEELRVANERLEQEIAERANVEQMLLQSQKLEVLGLLAGGVAHDFNNLLTAIGGYGELVVNHMQTDSPVAKAAMEIVHAADRAAGLTKQLLVFSRQQVQTARVTDLNDVLGSLGRLLRPLIGEDVQLSLEPADQPLRARVDPQQLELVLMNLAVNARDAMPGGGELSIEAAVEQHDGPMAVLRVIDDGIGMDEATAERIFDPFFTTKRVGAGTGLGLATARTIVTQAGGQIAVSSTPGVGTEIALMLPLLGDDVAVEPVSTKPIAAIVTPRTVLVVEDERVVRDLVTGVLRRLGHRVLEASNGADALSLFDAHADEVELVITDVIMPETSGPQMVREMRAERPELPVIFVSGYTDDRLADFDLGGRATAFIAKPFRLGRLEEVMAQLLNDVPAARAPKLRSA